MHGKTRWHVMVLAVLVISALVAVMAAGCGGTTTVTETKTVTTTAAGAGTTATVTQVVTKTVTPAATTTTATSPITTTSPTGPKTTIKLSIGSGHATAAVWVKEFDDFLIPEISKRVEARTNYKIEWTKAWGGSVAKLGEELEAVESGLLDMGLTQPVFEPTKLKLQMFPFFNPFDSADPVQIGRVVTKLFQAYPIIWDGLKDYNSKVLGFSVTGPYGIISKFPMTSPDDLNGRKIMAAGPNLPIVSEVGAVPVQGSYQVAYTDLATGVYEGVCGDARSMLGFKLQEVAPYWTDAGIGAKYNGLIIINLGVWNKLPKEVQDILAEVAQEYQVHEAKMMADETKAAEKALAEAGAHVSALTYDEMLKWANKLSDIPVAKGKEMDGEGLPGTEVLKTWNKLLIEDGFNPPRDWFGLK